MNQDRLARVQARMAEVGVDAVAATSPVKVDYLTGFAEGTYERFLSLTVFREGAPVLVCPALTENQARRHGIEDIHPWRDGENPYALLHGLLAKRSALRVAVDDEYWAKHLLALQHECPGCHFSLASDVVDYVMRAKAPDELAKLRAAGKIVDDAFAELLTVIRAGQTELEVQATLQGMVAARGGKPTFCQVAAGPAGAEPHHQNDDRPLTKGDVVVIDFGCEVEGYQADITRTIGVQEVSDRAREVYDVVYRAHMAGRNAIRAGVTGGHVDHATRQVIEEAGFGEFFNHRTGHGIGRRVHEAPEIGPGSGDVLMPGDCFSVEPGIYLPLELGVRIENIVTATTEGHECLNAEPSPTLILIS